jgi:hypothetical protein
MVATPSVKPPSSSPIAPPIAWVAPPADFVLDDTPVENNGQPLIAGALRESLELTGRIPATGLIASNFGLCVRIGETLILKAPDWLYIAQVNEPGIPRKSYTPHLDGNVPDIVMEFLSDMDGEEYSHRRIFPVGKWYFYEEILKVPTYVILDPKSGLLEVYRLRSGHYELEQPDEEGRHWFTELGLFLGTWRGVKDDHPSYWLRWWDSEGVMLPWAIEKIEQEQQQTEQERQRADLAQQQAEQEKQRADLAQEQANQEKQRADRLAELLRAQGIDPDA